MSSALELTLEQLVCEVETLYKPLLGMTFQGSIHEENTPAVCTAGPRDVVNVHDQGVIAPMATIVAGVEEVSKMFEPYNSNEKVWKGITFYNGPQLWVTSLAGSGPNFMVTYNGDKTTFTVANIEVLTGLNWQKSYRAMVNITLI